MLRGSSLALLRSCYATPSIKDRSPLAVRRGRKHPGQCDLRYQLRYRDLLLLQNACIGGSWWPFRSPTIPALGVKCSCRMSKTRKRSDLDKYRGGDANQLKHGLGPFDSPRILRADRRAQAASLGDAVPSALQEEWRESPACLWPSSLHRSQSHCCF